MGHDLDADILVPIAVAGILRKGDHRAVKKVEEIEVSVAEVVKMMRINGQFEGPLNQAVTRKLTAESAKESGITVSTEELQNAVDQFRAARGLVKKQDTEDWLKARQLSLEDLESHLETDILTDKFKNALDHCTMEDSYSAQPEVRLAMREVVYRAWLAEQFRQVE